MVAAAAPPQPRRPPPSKRCHCGRCARDMQVRAVRARLCGKDSRPYVAHRVRAQFGCRAFTLFCRIVRNAGDLACGRSLRTGPQCRCPLRARNGLHPLRSEGAACAPKNRAVSVLDVASTTIASRQTHRTMSELPRFAAMVKAGNIVVVKCTSQPSSQIFFTVLRSFRPTALRRRSERKSQQFRFDEFMNTLYQL
jgi:hypothetical protein